MRHRHWLLRHHPQLLPSPLLRPQIQSRILLSPMQIIPRSPLSPPHSLRMPLSPLSPLPSTMLLLPPFESSLVDDVTTATIVAALVNAANATVAARPKPTFWPGGALHRLSPTRYRLLCLQHWPMRRERWSVRSTLCRRGMPRIVRLHGFRRSSEGLSRGMCMLSAPNRPLYGSTS